MRLRYARLEREHQTSILFPFIQPSKHHKNHPPCPRHEQKPVLVEAQLCCHCVRDTAFPSRHYALKPAGEVPHACCACPCRNANSARTSVTYCSPSSIGIRCRRSLSVGSEIQPSIGIALSANHQIKSVTLALCCTPLTLVRGLDSSLTHLHEKYNSLANYPKSSPGSNRVPPAPNP